MCGRFSLITPPVRLARYFQAALGEGLDSEQPPSWNVAPTDPVIGVTAHRTAGSGLERALVPLRWGLIPWWSKDATSGNRLFNARAETVTTKPSFRDAFKGGRIIIPADGFYEWQRFDDGTKVPNYFTRSDGQPMAFAGLSERWRDKNGPADAPPIRSCTIITTAAGPDMDGIHDRMPVILNADTFDLWLDPEVEETGELTALLRATPDGTVVHHPVSSRVGNVRNNGAELIEPA